MAEMDIHGNIIRRARPNLPDTRYEPAASTRSSNSLNWWDRLNNFVIGIGNWLADHTSGITEGIMGIAGIAAIIGLLIWIVGVFSDDGAIWGILSIFGAIFIGYIIFAIIGIASYVLGFLLLIIRFLFWNIYVLLISLTITGVLTFATFNSNSFNYDTSSNEQYSTPHTTKYRCTARVLNVRYAPDTNAKVLGVLKANEEVEVYEIINDFAKIKYGTGVAYASSPYLKKQ